MTNIANKDTLIARTKKEMVEEKRLVGKIISQIKSAKKNPQVPLNIEEKQLRAHLNEEIKKWEARKIPKIINKFLEEIKSSLQNKEDIILWGYFSLKVRRSLKVKARNPQTGESIIIKPKNRISFRASPKLKKQIN
jgi:DNA-binding protein HU-beta